MPEADRPEVIRRCYHPLLDIAEAGVPVGIEATGWTLRQIEILDPVWIKRFRKLLNENKCELVGSGYVQLIGPLVPVAVNRHNQRLGMEVYETLLGQRPRLALLNEMAFSPGLVPIYLEYGYQGLIMDRPNVELAVDGPMPAAVNALGSDGSAIPILWCDAILFQKFQRVVHGDIPYDDFLAYLKIWEDGDQPLALYCSDAETFDFRTRRFSYEQAASEGEWTRAGSILSDFVAKGGFGSPSEVLASLKNPVTLNLCSISQPVPVKKQPKYNVSRWAITGRGDISLNTSCHRLAQTMDENSGDDAWLELCELWSSDLRTHIHPPRFEAAVASIHKLLESKGVANREQSELDQSDRVDMNSLADKGVHLKKKDLYLEISTPVMDLVLNTRRGLAVKSLAFERHERQPCAGTLVHGYFREIDLGADFYTGGTVIELPGQLKRITDLETTEPEIFHSGGRCHIRAQIETSLGLMLKTLSFDDSNQSLSLRYDFPGWERPFGVVRLGNFTLIPDHFKPDLSLSCHNGGAEPDHYPLDRSCDHPAAVSSLISCTTGLGATNGEIRIGDDTRAVLLYWDPGQCAAFPMLIHRHASNGHFTRIAFSLAEMDDTRKPGGELPPFEFRISAS